ncbi:hypothetical protein ACFQ07_05415, partial [Actinomadura adrarensis]
GRWRQSIGLVPVVRPMVDRPVLAGGLLHIGNDAIYSFEPSTGRRVRKLETQGSEPLGVVLRVNAWQDTLYVLHYRASQSFRRLSAIRTRP